MLEKFGFLSMRHKSTCTIYNCEKGSSFQGNNCVAIKRVKLCFKILLALGFLIMHLRTVRYVSVFYACDGKVYIVFI